VQLLAETTWNQSAVCAGSDQLSKQYPVLVQTAQAHADSVCCARRAARVNHSQVLTSWLSQVDVPAKSDLKDWELQVSGCVGL